MERTVSYRSSDPIQNLRLRVELKRLLGGSPDQPDAPAAKPAAPNKEEGANDEKPAGKKRLRDRFGKKFGRSQSEKEDGAGSESGEGGGGDAEGHEGADEQGEDQGEREEGEEGEEQADRKKATKPKPAARVPEAPAESWVKIIGWQEKVSSRWEKQNVEPHQNAAPVARKALSDSRIFTYVSTDEYTKRSEIERTVSTSETELMNPLPRALALQSSGNHQLLRHQTMYIMADCSENDAEKLEKVLVVIKAYPDGSIDMRPGLNRVPQSTGGDSLGEPYEFQDENGVLWCFTVTNAANTSDDAGAERRDKLIQEHNQKAYKGRANREFEPAPGPFCDALRFVFMAEIVAGKDFNRDKLWVEYDIRYDPQIWVVNPEPSEAGHLLGCTHVSTCTQYPGEPGRGILPHYVAHFSHPVECEFIAQVDPKASQWPRMYFQVNTYDNWDRYTVEGYTHMSLHAVSRGGYATHRLTTWKPLGSVVDRLNSFFIGGSPELKDVTYTGIPQGFDGKFLSKFGFKAETSGVLKVRTSAVRQQRRPAQDIVPAPPDLRRSTMGASITERLIARARGTHTLEYVVERARRRLEEARRGEVGVLHGAVEAMKEPPVIVTETNPELKEVEEGQVAGFSIRAKGRNPLSYKWYKDGKALHLTHPSNNFGLTAGVTLSDAGEYYCKVSNTDGTADSRPAKLVVFPTLGFAEHPEEYIECEEGETATIVVVPQGKPPLTFAWFKDGTELTINDSCTTPELVLSGVKPIDSGKYHCVVSNERKKQESEQCELSVKAKSKVGDSGRGSGDDEGEGGEENEAEGASSSQSQGSPSDEDDEVGSSGGGSDVEPGEKAEEEAGGTEHRGKETDDVKPPVITTHPASASVQEGDSVEFRVSAEGSRLSFQWLHNGEPMPEETDSSLALMRPGREHEGEYSCRVSSAPGVSVLSDAAKLQIESPLDVGQADDEEDDDGIEVIPS